MPTDFPQQEPRFPAISRRAFLGRTGAVGVSVVAGSLLAACGGADQTAPSAAPVAGGTVSTGPAASTQPNTSTAASEDPTGQAGVPATQIDFTYQASGGGRVHSPYIAVWIEDPDGALVQTVSLWFKADERKYLRDLTRWNAKNNQDALTTGATRIPGAFSVMWDGTDLAGTAAPSGDYYVCIEATREDGPYQIIRQQVTISPALPPTMLTPDGELVSASISVVQ